MEDIEGEYPFKNFIEHGGYGSRQGRGAGVDALLGDELEEDEEDEIHQEAWDHVLDEEIVDQRTIWNSSPGSSRTKVVAVLTEPAVVDGIICHLGLTFAAENPPPGQIFEQVALMTALMEAMRNARLPLRPS
jgi:hypothetical protein